jgi:hypothetical protein
VVITVPPVPTFNVVVFKVVAVTVVKVETPETLAV